MPTARTSTDELQEIDFETNIMVLAFAAVEYSKGSSLAPLRHWGHDIGSEALRLGKDRFRFAQRRQDGGGILILKDVEFYAGGTETKQIFIPYAEMDRIAVSVRGKILG